MIICSICETENAVGLQKCILCAGEIAEQKVEAPSFDLEASDTPQELIAISAEPAIAEPARELLPSLTESLTAQSTKGIPNPEQESHLAPALETKAPTLKQPPPPGTLCLIVYFQRRPALYSPVVYDELLIGRTDPASNSYPDLDVTPYDPELAISRKHAYLYREGDNYFIYPISNSGTQVNQEMVDIGAKKKLKEGDVVILSGRLAIRFARIPGNRQA